MKKMMVRDRDGHIELLCLFDTKHLAKVVEHCFKCQSPSSGLLSVKLFLTS